MHPHKSNFLDAKLAYCYGKMFIKQIVCNHPGSTDRLYITNTVVLHEAHIFPMTFYLGKQIIFNLHPMETFTANLSGLIFNDIPVISMFHINFTVKRLLYTDEHLFSYILLIAQLCDFFIILMDNM